MLGGSPLSNSSGESWGPNVTLLRLFDCVFVQRESWNSALLGVFAVGEYGDSHVSWIEPIKEAEVVQDDRRERKLSPTLDGIGVSCLPCDREELGVDLMVGRKLDERSPRGKGEDTLLDVLFATGFTSCCINKLSLVPSFLADWTTAGDTCPVLQSASCMLSGLSAKPKELQLRDFGEAGDGSNTSLIHNIVCSLFSYVCLQSIVSEML